MSIAREPKMFPRIMLMILIRCWKALLFPPSNQEAAKKKQLHFIAIVTNLLKKEWYTYCSSELFMITLEMDRLGLCIVHENASCSLLNVLAHAVT